MYNSCGIVIILCVFINQECALLHNLSFCNFIKLFLVGAIFVHNVIFMYMYNVLIMMGRN